MELDLYGPDHTMFCAEGRSQGWNERFGNLRRMFQA